MHESKTDGPNFFKHGAKHFKNVMSFRLWFYAGMSLIKAIDTKYYVNTVKLGFKEQLNKEQVGNSEPFSVPYYQVQLYYKQEQWG